MPTVLHRLAAWADATPDLPAQKYKKNGNWQSISAREYRDRVFYLAVFLESRGFKAGDSGCILAYNSAEWVHNDLAVLLLGGFSAGVYPNSTPKEIRYILDHTGAKVLGIQNKDYFKKITADGQSLPNTIEVILVYDGDTSIHPKAVDYSEALATGKKIAKEKKISTYLNAIDPKKGAFLIYTSGTTGNPKGALLSHDNLVFTSDLAARHWKLPMARGSLFSFLPLCHVAEKLHSVGVGISQRYPVSYCTKFDAVATELAEVEPNLLLSVPRLWEKMMEGVMHKLKSAPTPRKKLAEWALGVGLRITQARMENRFPSPKDLAALPIAEHLVLKKIRKALGLGNASALASGAAALPAHVARWFRSLLLEIMEDYGQTESTGVICMTERGLDCAGTVGKPPEGIEVRIAGDGEILVRGRNVFAGYFKNEQATRETVDSDGWLYSGDLGEFDSQGMLRIKGRKKEILKTSGGKMVAPTPIEEALKAASMISQVCIVGDNRKYVSALITLSEEMLADLKKSGKVFSGDVIQDPTILSDIKKYVDELNSTLPQYEQIKRFMVLTREFSIDGGEMTATMKMKRSVVEKNYQHVIDQMYSSSTSSGA